MYITCVITVCSLCLMTVYQITSDCTDSQQLWQYHVHTQLMYYMHTCILHTYMYTHTLYTQAVLCSSPDMECGFSRDLFIQWCTNPHNSIIFTSKTGQNTLSRILIDNLKVSLDHYLLPIILPTHTTIVQVTSVDMNVMKRIPLQGAELEEYQAKEREKAAEK